MRIPLPKTAVRTLSYTIIFLSALYFVSPSLLSEEVPEKKDAVTTPKEGEKKDGEKPASTQNPAKKVEEKAVKPPKKSPGLIDLFLNGGWFDSNHYFIPYFSNPLTRELTFPLHLLLNLLYP